VTDPALKIALLAREGEARLLLRHALTELGADLVLEADPNTVDAEDLAASRVGAVLFSVEPATEAALDRLDAVLSDPALGVVFDEAETTARLSGWDLNRWARHLAAKLLGRDLLPPAVPAESEAIATAPDAAAFEVLDTVEQDEIQLSEAERAAFEAFEARQQSASRPPLIVTDPEPEFDLGLDPDFELAFELDADTAEPPANTIESDTDLADLAAELASEPEGKPSADPGPTPPAKPRSFDFSTLELAPLDALPATAPAALSLPSAALPDAGRFALAPIEGEEDTAAASGRLVLVLSGMGGPDAVRQLLRALPAGFPAAVLLRQSLDGGRHDRFVEQLAKVSRLPVGLASTHETPPPQAVRVLADTDTVAGALRFSGGLEDLMAAVAASDGAVLVLSGAEAAAIAPLTAALANGLRVIVQDPADCFEPTAAEALRRAGARVAGAADLAARLDACFSP